MEQDASYSNDSLLFHRIAAGDEDAYTTIFKQYTPRLYPYILKIVKTEHIAKELVQETFLRLWMHRDQLTDIKLPGSWLFRIAANLSLEYLRKEAYRNNLQGKLYEKAKTADNGITETVEKRDLELIIRKAVDILPDKRKEVYLLSRQEGLSHQEIAEQLGITVSTVKTHLGLALKFLREHLHNQTGLSVAVLALILNG